MTKLSESLRWQSVFGLLAMAKEIDTYSLCEGILIWGNDGMNDESNNTICILLLKSLSVMVTYLLSVSL